MRLVRPVWFVAIFAVATSCFSGVSGPVPDVTGVSPDVICTAQTAQEITITGSGFSPAVLDGLKDGRRLVMPRVFLIRSDGEVEISPENVSLPAGDDSGTALVVAIPQGALSPSTAGEAEVVYDIRVENPNDNEGALLGALTVVPPPDLTSVDPDSGAQDTQVTVTLTGTGFRDGMTVTLQANPPVPGTDVVVSSSTEASAVFDLTGVETGTYDVTIANSEGCSVTLAGAFTVFDPSIFDLDGIDPPFGCTCEDTTVTIFSSGQFSSTPRVEMRPHGQSGPVVQFERVAFVDSSTLTAVVPAGADLGHYDVTVINPPTDGRTATLENGFEVVSLPVPTIEAIVPSRGSPTSNTDVSIFGENFRIQVLVELIDASGAVAATAGPVDPVDQNRIDVTLPTMGMMEDAYLVRVTNLDQGTFSTFSSFLVAETGPSGNLHTFTAQSSLVTGRRMLAGASARDDLGNRFLYALGGDTGAGGAVLDTVEVSQLSRFGRLAAWRESQNRFNTPRVGAAAVAVPLFDLDASPFVPVKTYLYVLGGRSDTGAVLASIERAVVLSPSDAPRITSIAAVAGGSLDPGTWYYKVSAILDAGDPDNPGGETLPSDEEIITIGGADGSIALTWDPVEVNGVQAVSYRVYRTDEANGVSQTQHLIATVSGTSYTDTGDAAGTESPLPPGSPGVWQVESGTLSQARWGHQAATVTDGADQTFVYVLGGKSDATTGYLDSVEYAPVDDTDGALGGFTTDDTTPLTTPRAFFSLTVQTPENVSGFTGGARLFALGGTVADAGVTGNHAVDTFEMSDVIDGGGNDDWNAYAGAGTIGTRGGPMAVITSEKLFVMGGAMMAPDNTSFTNVLATGSDVGFLGTGELGSPIQSTAESLLAPRALGAVLTGAGFIYFVGGSSNGTNAVATTEKTF
jgi:hypothetical protein